MGALVPFVGVRAFRPPHRRFASQQTTELYAIAAVMRLAIRLRHHSVTILSDSEAAIAQVLALGAKSYLMIHCVCSLGSGASGAACLGTLITQTWGSYVQGAGRVQGGGRESRVCGLGCVGWLHSNLDLCEVCGVICLCDPA